MIIKRLMTGMVTEDIVPNVEPGICERKVMLVHEGEFQSMDGPVKISKDIIENLKTNHNLRIAKARDAGAGVILPKFCPPVQLDHSTSAGLTVGRLVSELWTEILDFGGELKTCLMGTVRFLGAENIEKVMDGRWTHFSIGADLAKCVLNELSVTPFPADPDAALMSAKLGKIEDARSYAQKLINKGEDWMEACIKASEKYDLKEDQTRKLLEYFKGSNKLSTVSKGGTMKLMEKLKGWFKLSEDKDAEEKKNKMKKHLMDEKKMSEEDADKHLEACDEESMKKMAEEIDEKEKKLAADKAEEDKKMASEEEKKKEDMKKMSAAKENVVKLAKAIRSTNSELKMEAKKGSVLSRLSALRSQGKVSPAEIKKLDITKLAAYDESAIAAVMKTYEDREPVIDTAIHGTQKAVNLQKIAEKYKLARLELETRMNMPSKQKEAAVKLSKLAEEEKKEMSRMETEIHIDTTPHTHYDMSYEQLCKMMDEGKDKEEVKAAIKKMMEQGMKMGEGEAKDGEKRMSALDEKLKTLQNQFQELISTVGDSFGIDSKELE